MPEEAVGEFLKLNNKGAVSSVLFDSGSAANSGSH
jgi:hypothetical protein